MYVQPRQTLPRDSAGHPVMTGRQLTLHASNVVGTRHPNPMFQLEWHHSLHMTSSTLGVSWSLLWGTVNPAECAQRITVRVRHFSFRSLVGKRRWERRPVVATSPRLSSISGSGQDIAGESKKTEERNCTGPNAGEGTWYFKWADEVFSLN